MSDDATLELRGVSVGYGAGPVVHEVSLRVAADERLALLGPSGSGKTTLLYAIAGFTDLLAGEVLIRGRRVAGGGRAEPPEARRVGFVFQHYALWPHLTALETAAYPLRRDGAAGAEADRVARELLARLGIEHLADRRPAELSGGEQQRVGLARALARRPHLYLLDEPTAHLDATLKAALAEELASPNRQPGVATVHATHDVVEALAVADRVALMRDGRIVQVGTPVDVYERPVDRWAAALTGPASLLVGAVTGAGPKASVRLGDVTVQAELAGEATAPPALLLVRPDWARIGAGELSGRVAAAAYHGTHTDYRLETAAGSLLVRDAGSPRFAVGAEARWSLARVWPLPAGNDPGR